MRQSLIVDASVAIKWIYQEEFSPQDVFVLERYALVAPSLLLAECANILWKKVKRAELTDEEAILSVSALNGSGVELVDMQELAVGATRLATKIDHPAYDCFYIELSRRHRIQMISADERLIRKLRQHPLDGLPDALMLRDIVLAP